MLWTNLDSGGNRNVAHIQQGSGTVQISIGASDQVSPAAIYFDSLGSNASYKINGGAITLSNDMLIDIATNTAATINSAINGSNNRLLTADAGNFTLTGAVMVGSFIDDVASVQLSGPVTITNGDNSGAGLTVINAPVTAPRIVGTGPLVLQGRPNQLTPTAFSYISSYSSSTDPSVYSGPISGAGAVSVGGPDGSLYGTLQLTSAINSYSGGTFINGSVQQQSGTVQGTLMLGIDPTLHAPATLGVGGLTFGDSGILDLNGCSLTLTSLVATVYGTEGITDTSNSSGTSRAPVTVLTLDIPQPPDPNDTDTYEGRISDLPWTGLTAMEPAIRVVKTGAGGIFTNGDWANSGGVEIDDGGITFLNNGTGNAGPAAIVDLTMNGGNLDMNGRDTQLVGLNGSGGIISDSSTPPASGRPTHLDVSLTSVVGQSVFGGVHPSVFGGVIDDGNHGQAVALYIDGIGDGGGGGTLVLTADMSGIADPTKKYTGGTFVDQGCLQIGDGQTNGAIQGEIAVGCANALVFDVAATAAGAPEVFNGQISNYDVGIGSVMKTGPGELLFGGDTGRYGGIQYAGNTYLGAMRVQGGKLTLGDGTALPGNGETTSSPPQILDDGSELIIDDGAVVDFASHSIGNATSGLGELRSVTLNNGSIISTGGSSTICAIDSFNLANGAIGTGVTLAGSASVNKRSDGTVTFAPSAVIAATGGTFDDQGQMLQNSSPIATTSVTTLYWRAPANLGTAHWSDPYWSDTPNGTPGTWPTDASKTYVAVFDAGYADVSISTSFLPPREIKFDPPSSGTASFDIEDATGSTSYISMPDSESLVVDVGARTSAQPWAASSRPTASTERAALPRKAWAR